ncbi:MAG: right-handed parallel beta-helix repeat-containing protein [Clostridia bacterium]|nr:right-handed parallel beta-helix repeat-containing protein [Clostridia bacterium]
MNDFCNLVLNIKDNDTVVLEKDKLYDVRQDDSFILKGFFCSNTAKKHENPDGTRFSAIYLNGKKNITIDGNGATLLIHGKMTPILLNNCENITIKNLTIDYACPTMAEFKVLSNENGAFVIEINKDCLYRVEGNNLIWQGENDLNGVPYWEDSYIGNRRHIKLIDPETDIPRDFRRADLNFEAIEDLGNNQLKVTLVKKDADFPVGAVLQTRNIVRDQTGSLFQRCKNLNFENLRVKFMHGLGMVSQFCENVTYKSCDFTPADHRTITSTADFFQFSGCKGDIIIENCKANGAHDDYINVHGTHLRIIEADYENNSMIVRFMHDESWGFQAFEVGDELEFIKWNNLQPYAQTKVKAYKKLNDSDILLCLDRALPEIEIGKDVVENATWTPNLYVRNCDFGRTSGRGILCTTRGEVIIENNRFYKLWGPALLMEDDCNFWFESGYSKRVVFRNNVIDTCDHGTTYPNAPVIRYTPKIMDENFKGYVHGRLIVENNVFINPICKKHCLHLEYLNEAEIRNNIFDADFIINIKNVESIIEENNTIKGSP